MVPWRSGLTRPPYKRERGRLLEAVHPSVGSNPTGTATNRVLGLREQSQDPRINIQGLTRNADQQSLYSIFAG